MGFLISGWIAWDKMWFCMALNNLTKQGKRKKNEKGASKKGVRENKAVKKSHSKALPNPQCTEEAGRVINGLWKNPHPDRHDQH